MKLMLCGSVVFAEKFVEIENELKKLGHDSKMSDLMRQIAERGREFLEEVRKDHAKVKRDNDLIKWYYDRIEESDGILVLNYDKKGIKNYIGGNTLLEIGFAHVLGKRIFLLNTIPDIGYKDEINAMNPIVLNGDLSKIN
jgi:hypothetical protein